MWGWNVLSAYNQHIGTINRPQTNAYLLTRFLSNTFKNTQCDNFQCTISVNQNALRSNSVHFELYSYFVFGPWKHSFWNSRWNSETCLSNIGQILWAGNYQFGKPEKDRWTTKWSPDIETGEWLQDLRPPWGNSAVTEAFSSKTGSKPSLWWHLSICGWAVS